MASKEIGKKILDGFKKWFNEPFNPTFVALLVLIIAIRFYFFYITRSQPLWWDEAEYMSAAKGYAGIVDYSLGIQRLPGFPLLASLFFMLGITNEVTLRFFLNFIPSVLTVAGVYFCVSEMYKDKRIAIISTIIFGVLWQSIFYSNRFHTENLSLLFQLGAIFVLFRFYLKKEKIPFINSRYVPILALLLMGIAVVFRPASGLAILPIILLAVWSYKTRIFSKKALPYAVIGIGLLIVATYFGLGILGKAGYYNPGTAPSFKPFNVFYDFFLLHIKSIPPLFFYALLLGGAIVLLNLFFLYEKIIDIKKEDTDISFKSDLFCVVLIACVMLLFIYVVRTPNGDYEPRWFLPLVPALVILPSKGIIYASSFAGKILKSKNVEWIVMIVILLLGAYTQIVQTDAITKARVDSYLPVKEAAFWIKSNSNPNDVIYSVSQTQTTYYSERKISFYPENESAFMEEIERIRPRFMVLSIFEPHSPWTLGFPASHPALIYPVNAWSQVYNGQRSASLVIYAFNYSNLQSEKERILNLSLQTP